MTTKATNDRHDPPGPPVDPDNHELTALLPAVYEELRLLAQAYLNKERRDHTLQPTALVHEAYMRLTEHSDLKWQDRAHFYRLAARVMRQILVNHAIRKRRVKHGGTLHKMPLEAGIALQLTNDVDLIELDELLRRLSKLDLQKAQIVELKFFAGCTLQEIAEAIGVSTATVERDWKLTRAWLHSEMSKSQVQ